MPYRTTMKAMERERRDLLAQYVTQGRKFDADSQVKHWMRAQKELTEAEDTIKSVKDELYEMGVDWTTCDHDHGWSQGFTPISVYQYSTNNIEDFLREIRADVFACDDANIRQQSIEQGYQRQEDVAVFMMETVYQAQSALFENAWKVARAQAKKFVAQKIHRDFTESIKKGKQLAEERESRLMGSAMTPTPRRVPMISFASSSPRPDRDVSIQRTFNPLSAQKKMDSDIEQISLSRSSSEMMEDIIDIAGNFEDKCQVQDDDE